MKPVSLVLCTAPEGDGSPARGRVGGTQEDYGKKGLQGGRKSRKTREEGEECGGEREREREREEEEKQDVCVAEYIRLGD